MNENSDEKNNAKRYAFLGCVGIDASINTKCLTKTIKTVKAKRDALLTTKAARDISPTRAIANIIINGLEKRGALEDFKQSIRKD